MLGVAGGRAPTYTLALALGLSALGAGGVHLSVLLPVAALVALSGVLSARGATARRSGADDAPSSASGRLVGLRAHRLSLAAMVPLALSLWSLVQALPVPMPWLERLVPETADIWSRSLRAFGVPPPARASLSLAPGRSLVEALEMATHGVVFAVSARFASRRGAEPLARLIFGLALCVALVTAAHQIVGASRLYGLYRPLNATSVAPILNKNSLGGYLNLGWFAGLGLLFAERDLDPRVTRSAVSLRPLLAIGLVPIAAEVILSRSRGAVASLAVGLVIYLACGFVVRRASERGSRRPELAARSLALVFIGVFAVGIALLAGRRSGFSGLTDDSLIKLQLFRRSAELAREHLGWGIGRGAFGSVFFAHQGGMASDGSFDHVENALLQWAIEWGGWVTLAALATTLWAAWPVVQRRALRHPVRRGLLVGCAVLSIQNLADLGFEIPGVAGLFWCCLGALLGSVARASRSVARAPGRWVTRGGAALVLCTMGLVAAFGSPTLPRERQRLYAELLATEGQPTDEFWSELRKGSRSFPADPYFPLLGASAALASGRDALPFVARALERAPRLAESHLQLARVLRARGATDQALGAVRRAVELHPRRDHEAIALMSGWDVSPARMRRAVPEGPAGARMLRRLAQRSRDPSLRVAWLRDAAGRNAEDTDTRYALSRALLSDLRRGAAGPHCNDRRAACLAEARRHAAAGGRPGHPRSEVLAAELLMVEGRSSEAEARLEATCQRFPRDAHCAEALVRLALENDSRQLEASIERLVSAGCDAAASCAGVHLRLSRMLSRAGRAHQALGHLQSAARERPTAEAWGEVAMAASRLGRPRLAERARVRARALEQPAAAAAPGPAAPAPLPPSSSPRVPPSESAAETGRSDDR